jgi:hypothetical protein
VQRKRLLIAVRAIAGLLLGILLWWGFSPPYTEVLAALAEPIVRALERSPVTRLRPMGGEIIISRADFRPGTSRPVISAAHLTANIILLTALFAANAKPLALRNVAGFAQAALILVLIHILAVVVNVQSIYAWDLGEWSARNYGIVARTFWEGAMHFYTLAGSFGSAFLLWWLISRMGGYP